MVMLVSDGVGMCLSYALIFSDLVGSPVDVQYQQPKAYDVLEGSLLAPRLVLIRPGNIAIIGKFRLISFFEIFLPQLLLTLDRVVLEVPSPIVEVVVVEAESSKCR
jgi:hypothetical protein